MFLGGVGFLRALGVGVGFLLSDPEDPNESNFTSHRYELGRNPFQWIATKLVTFSLKNTPSQEEHFLWSDSAHCLVLSPEVPKLVRAVIQTKVASMFYYPQYLAVIAHNIEKHRGFGSALPPEESHITPEGNLPQFGNHWITQLPVITIALRVIAQSNANEFVAF